MSERQEPELLLATGLIERTDFPRSVQQEVCSNTHWPQDQPCLPLWKVSEVAMGIQMTV